MVGADLDRSRVTVHLGIDGKARVQAEREPLLEFITTLLLGARDATPGNEPIEIRSDLEDGFARLQVIDHGPTLTEEILEALFEPLGTAAAARSLSLATGRQAVLRWGGDVDVRVRARGGNLFEVKLPIGAAPAEEPRPAEPAPLPKVPHRRILVVDDDDDNAEMLAELIRDSDGDAITVGTGKEAIDRSAALRPDAALVDLLLPDMKGWEVVRSLQEQIPGIRIAVVSGLAVSRSEREASGADAVFRKPVDSEELLRFLGL
jgi:CheY-like chemotaxis protein